MFFFRCCQLLLTGISGVCTAVLSNILSLPAAATHISGRQHPLSQQISVYYIAHPGQIQGIAFKEMLPAAPLFRDSLQVLQNSPITTPQVKQGLQAVEKEWFTVFQEPARAKNRKIPAEAFLARTTHMLTKMDQLTLAYQQFAY